MQIDDMFLSLDMKLHPESYGEETGTGGGPDGFDVEASWKNSYNRLTDSQKQLWDAHYEEINREFKESNLSGKALSEWKYRRYMEDYLASVASVDENVGRVLDYLDEHDLTKNTIVIYTSDQGFYLGEHGWYDKRFMYEESLRMPLVMRFPREVMSGQVNDNLVLNLDFAPTLLDYAGVQIPKEFQGKSFRELAKDGGPIDWRSSIYYEYFEYPHGWHSVHKHYGVRTNRYKLIHFYDIEHWELFDLEKDPNELENLFDRPEMLEVQRELLMELDRLKDQYAVDHLPG